MTMADDDIKAAWDKVKDSKDYVSHELVMGEVAHVLTWAYQMRADMAAFIEMLEVRLQFEVHKEGRTDA